jgi:hypothetical protein
MNSWQWSGPELWGPRQKSGDGETGPAVTEQAVRFLGLSIVSREQQLILPAIVETAGLCQCTVSEVLAGGDSKADILALLGRIVLGDSEGDRVTG